VRLPTDRRPREQRGGGDHANAGDAEQALSDRTLVGDRRELALECGQVVVEGTDIGEQPRDEGPQPGRDRRVGVGKEPGNGLQRGAGTA
jgi:hypothetical protein